MSLQNLNHQSFFANPETRIALSEIVYQQQIILAFQKLRENDIEPILIKGWSIEQFYPPGKKRKTADIDLCVNPRDYNKSQIIIKQLGFKTGIIDLHNGLRHLDKLVWANLLNHSRLVALRTAQIRVLCPEDNLRVTCVHWLNDGGADKEKLWDIYYQVVNRSADFDWRRCLESNGVKRRQWILCVLAITNRYLDLPLTEMPFADEIKTVLPRWLTPALEREWSDKVKIVKLEKFLQEHDWKSLKQQLGKRFKPNPIGASINVEAPFDDAPRLPYQIADIIIRFQQHFARNTKALLKFLLSVLNKT